MKHTRIASIALAALAVLITALAAPLGAQPAETEVRVAARKTEADRIEFGFQERGSGGQWGERVLPRQRFFPEVDHQRWLASSGVRLATAEVVVRILARRTETGRIEFGLQWSTLRGEWGERLLPRQRFFPEVDHQRWLHSTPVAVGPATSPLLAPSTEPIAVLDDSAPGEPLRWRLEPGESFSFRFGERSTPRLIIPEDAAVLVEFRDIESIQQGRVAVLIFESGDELIIHPDLLDNLLARTDITDSTALAVLASLRRSVDEARFTRDAQPPAEVPRIANPTTAEPVDLSPSGPPAVVSGAGIITVQFAEFQLTLSLPETKSRNGFLLVALPASEDDLRPALYVVSPDHPEQPLIISFETGAEIRRVVTDPTTAAELNAIFDGIAQSVGS